MKINILSFSVGKEFVACHIKEIYEVRVSGKPPKTQEMK